MFQYQLLKNIKHFLHRRQQQSFMNKPKNPGSACKSVISSTRPKETKSSLRPKKSTGTRRGSIDTRSVLVGRRDSVDRKQEETGQKECGVNPRIHLHQDVPEEVQQFIKKISVEPRPAAVPDLLRVQTRKARKLPENKLSAEEINSAEVTVIVTSEWEPNTLTNADYDRLKQVGAMNNNRVGEKSQLLPRTPSPFYNSYPTGNPLH